MTGSSVTSLSAWSGLAPCAAVLMLPRRSLLNASRRLPQPMRSFIATPPRPPTPPNRSRPPALKLTSFMSVAPRLPSPRHARARKKMDCRVKPGNDKRWIEPLNFHVPFDRPPTQRPALDQIDHRVNRQHQRDRYDDPGEHAGRVRHLTGLFDRPADPLRRDLQFPTHPRTHRPRQRDLEPGEEERQQRGPDDLARHHPLARADHARHVDQALVD